MIEATLAMLVGAATPGPNNVLAMQAGALGPRAVVRVIAGVVLGSVGLLSAVWLGGTALPPWLREALGIAGACYLAVLGISLALGSNQAIAAPVRSVGAVALLQLGNPKAWIIAIAITAPIDRTPGSFAALLAIATLIPAVCLTLWSAIGHLVGRRRWLDIASGALLVVAAAEVLR